MSELAPAARAPVLPPLALAAFIISVAGAGALANCAALAALFRTSTNGLFSIIIQLATVDLLLGITIATELWSWNARTWSFGSSGCTAYQGLSVFATTASLYLVAAAALHTLASTNLEEKSEERRIKRTGRDEDEEIRSSRHSLVATSDSSTPPRTMNVDYRLADTRVPVALPTVFVWILAASLSVPEFALASVVHLEKGIAVCTLDSSHRFNMHSMLGVFVLLLPFFIMSSTSALIIVKLRSKKRMPEAFNCESLPALKLSLWLMFVCCVLCVPRSVVSGYRVYITSISDKGMLEDDADVVVVISLALSGAYLAATLVRPLLYIILLPRLRKVISFISKDKDHV